MEMTWMSETIRYYIGIAKKVKQRTGRKRAMEESKKIKNRKKTKKSFKSWLGVITTNKSVGQLVFRSIMMILVPYIYLYVCGLMDTLLLRAGFAYREAFILFVFFTLMAAWIMGLVLIVIAIRKWFQREK